MKKTEQPVLRVLCGGMIGSVGTVALALLLLLPAAMLMLKNKMPAAVETSVPAACIFPGGILGGILSRRKGRGSLLISVLTAGLSSFLLLCLLGLLLLQDLTFSEAGLIACSLALGTFLGALLARDRRKRTRR